ncbi:NAD-dependent epimerase/dehydratase family protein [Streptomyces sp. DSM 44915]|uniref:NAD-dependent epimerase/dehydratase family protein n=1 Tax=Streptomyces chisholmiae TaxID=3075540 RepID=A0ABU2JXG4_9ACTN|nr:NAD-dependent epimerase/dehydratase family protein [Streptomyces sp. DSM 44915]MDT0269642.1 NAD-dependent epimerase/dehydratase family protein [Streptomyces sp. DSM 44915]
MRVFVTGATGYIGGSVATRLRREGHQVDGLTRSPEGARRLAASGVRPVLGTLDDVAVLTDAARTADAVVNAADSDHRSAVETLIEALAGSGKPLLHTSGSSIVGDDARGLHASDQVFAEQDVHGGRWEPTADKAPRVAIDRLVLAAADRSVAAMVLCNSMIYGHGTGLSRDSVQIPRLVRQARDSGVVRHIGTGSNIWSHAHIDDVVDLYLRALRNPLPGAFLFVENGEASFAEITHAIADALDLPPARPWALESAIEEWGEEPARYALASNSRVRGGRARQELGWQPRHSSVTRWILGHLND